MQRRFSTPHPVTLIVELGIGDLVVGAGDSSESVVDVADKDEDAVTVEQHDDEIMVIARRGGFFGNAQHVSVRISVPTDSRLSTKLGSAPVRVEGRIGETTVKTGSGDVTIDQVSADARIETGSGDVRVGSVTGDLLVKSGSGDLRVGDALEDVALSTATGHLVVDRVHRGQLTAKNVSGDISVGVPAGIPVWTDVTTVTGSVRSNLLGAGQPEDDQDYIELRATSVSGNVTLEQL